VQAPPTEFEIFFVATPGLEAMLLAEVVALKFKDAKQVIGGVTALGGWPEVWRANLQIRGAGRVLLRMGAFHVGHLAQLDKLSRKFPWHDFLRKDVAVRVEATCRKSRIYHAGAATQRIETALREELGATVSDDADVCIKARIENDLCTLSIDTSGGMLGSGTFVIEAAEIVMGLYPGRSRHFAFEHLKSFDSSTWAAMQANTALSTSLKFYGSDRDAGAIASSMANAKRAGVESVVEFRHASISDLQRPDCAPGLVIVNPPYGTRIGDKRPLFDLHASFGNVMRERFSGWRVAMITTDIAHAKATSLPFRKPGPTINHGGLPVKLFLTPALK
jgi:putative N6-adenine-specific DNA methylase